MAEREITSWGILNEEEPDFDVEKGPRNPTDFWFDLRVDVKEAGKSGISSYQVFVCTPSALLSRFEKLGTYVDGTGNWSGQYIFGRGLLIVRQYNIDHIIGAITQVLDKLDEYAFDLT